MSAAPQPLIGIDARAAAEVPAGRGRLVRELLLALARRDEPLRVNLYARTAWDGLPADPRFTWRLIDAPDPLWHVRAAAAAGTDDVFLSTNSYLTAWFLRPPSIVVVCDLVPWVPGAQAQRRAARIERATIRPALRRARGMLCISQATEHDLVARFPAARGKTFVAPLAADERFFAPPAPGAVPSPPAAGGPLASRSAWDRTEVKMKVGEVQRVAVNHERERLQADIGLREEEVAAVGAGLLAPRVLREIEAAAVLVLRGIDSVLE